MRTLILMVFIIGLFQNAHCQFAFNNVPFKLKNPPSRPYKIIQSRNGEVSKVQEINNNGEVIFQYIQGDIPPFFNWKEPHRFIYAFEYDSNGRIVKRYAFNSNAGHNIYVYAYNDELNTKTTFERSYPKTGGAINTNAYAKISRIKNFKNLIESSEVSSIVASEKVFLRIEYLNETEQPIRIKDYGKMYKDLGSTSIEYDNTNRELSRKIVSPSGDIKKKIIKEYPDYNSKVTTIINYRKGQKMSSYQYAEVKDDSGETKTEYSVRSEALNIRHYQYRDGYLTNIKVYSTKFKNQLIVPISKRFKMIAKMEYSYNEDGLLDKEKLNNYKTGEKETRTYNYQIESE